MSGTRAKVVVAFVGWMQGVNLSSAVVEKRSIEVKLQGRTKPPEDEILKTKQKTTITVSTFVFLPCLNQKNVNKQADVVTTTERAMHSRASYR